MAITELKQIDAIGRDGCNLRLAIVDILDWEYEDMHLEILQDKINNYLTFIETKQYVKEYGDNYEKKIIDIFFQHGITENGIKFINVISIQLKKENIFIGIHFSKAETENV